jgi:hypothetical protein
MKHRFAFSIAIVFVVSSLACDTATTYPITFTCGQDGGTACPPGTACPALPLGIETCGDLPGVLGHPAIPVTVGRPLGCVVGLPYGNQYYGDSQQTCICAAAPGASPSSPSPQWQCPI